MSPEAINDEFSSIPSRRRRYQLRNAKHGMCVGCGKRATRGGVKHPHCDDCYKKFAVRRDRSMKKLRLRSEPAGKETK